MASYRCYFVGTNGQLVGAETIVSDTDQDAAAIARDSFLRRAYAVGYELRQGSRQIAVQEAQAS